MTQAIRGFLAAAALAVVSVAGHADGPSSPSGSGGPLPSRTDPVLQQAMDANSKQDWTRAASLLRDALAKSPQNADYHNLYAYSMRKGPNPDMGLVFKHYGEALRIDPGHRGAHEYIGEAYLQVGELSKAKEHLSALDRLCFFPCEEFTDLKKKVADYEAKTK